MNAAPGSARRLGIGVVVAVAALTLAGCAAGQHAPMAEEVPVVDGVSADAGPIALRAVTVAAPTNGSYPADGDATLQLVIVNDGHTPDKLVGVRTAQANEVRLFANATDAASAAAPSSSASAEPSSSAPATPSPTQSTSAAPVPSALESLDLPAGHLAPGPSTTPTETISPTAPA